MTPNRDPASTPLPAGASAAASPSPGDLPQRSHPAHGVFPTLNTPTIVFLTVCTEDRRPWLATGDVHELLRQVWLASAAWLVGRYVVMPDHIHLFASPGAIEVPFDNWVRYWKSQFTKRHRNPAHQWQPDHWDRRLRTGESYEEKWGYVYLNPVRKGLVVRPEDWKYAGELNVLPWN